MGKPSTFALGCAALALTTMCCWTYMKHRERDQAAYFANALMPVGNEAVRIGGRVYEVTHGVVSYNGASVIGPEAAGPLRLAYEKVIAERSPLIALPGVDPDLLDAQIQTLRVTAQELSKRQTNAADAQRVRDDLYPFAFLSAAAELERDRLSFIRSGSDMDAMHYRKALANAADAYTDGVERFRSAFEATVPADTERYANRMSVVSRQDILSAMDSLAAAMKKTEDTVARRERCFSGDTRLCDAADAVLPKFADTEQLAVSAPALDLAKEMRSIAVRTGVQFLPSSQPYYLMSHSSCAEERSGSQFLFQFRLAGAIGNAPGFIMPALFSDQVYVRSSLYATEPFFGYFAEHGVQYVISSPFTYYGCLQADRDLGTMLAMRDLRAFILKERLSSYASGAEAETLRQLETGLSEGSVVTESDIHRYVNVAENLIDENRLSETLSSELLTRTLQLRDRSLGLYVTLLNINRFEPNNIYLNSLGVKIDFRAVFLFFTRSAFAPLFMEGNLSAVGNIENLFPKNTLPSSEQPYVYYSALRSIPGIQNELVRDNAFYLKLHLNQ